MTLEKIINIAKGTADREFFKEMYRCCMQVLEGISEEDLRNVLNQYANLYEDPGWLKFYNSRGRNVVVSIDDFEIYSCSKINFDFRGFDVRMEFNVPNKVGFYINVPLETIIEHKNFYERITSCEGINDVFGVNRVDIMFDNEDCERKNIVSAYFLVDNEWFNEH